MYRKAKINPTIIYEVQDKSILWLINSQKTTTPEYINSPTCKLKDSSTQKLKLLSFILQSDSNFHSVLAKKQVKK